MASKLAGDLVLSRRAFLIGCSIAASPLLTPVTFAAAQEKNGLVVIILRGAMDGLDDVRPTKDVAYAGLRPTRAATLGPALTDFFTRHPDAAGLIPLWSAGELAFAHAVVTPYRSGRSHFVGQDALENGTVDGNLTPGHDGWLNRALSVMPNATNDTAVLVGQQRLLLPDGAHETDHWFPVTKNPLSAQGLDLLHAVNATAPLFAEPYALTQSLARSMNKKQAPKGGQADAQPGTYVAKRLTGASRIAGFSFGGWDTHNQQAKTMTDHLTSLTQVLSFMKTVWGGHAASPSCWR